MDATFSARTTAVSPSCTHSADAGPPSHLLHNHSLRGGLLGARDRSRLGSNPHVPPAVLDLLFSPRFPPLSFQVAQSSTKGEQNQHGLINARAQTSTKHRRGESWERNSPHPEEVNPAGGHRLVLPWPCRAPTAQSAA